MKETSTIKMKKVSKKEHFKSKFSYSIQSHSEERSCFNRIEGSKRPWACNQLGQIVIETDSNPTHSTVNDHESQRVSYKILRQKKQIPHLQARSLNSSVVIKDRNPLETPQNKSLYNQILQGSMEVTPQQYQYFKKLPSTTKGTLDQLPYQDGHNLFKTGISSPNKKTLHPIQKLNSVQKQKNTTNKSFQLFDNKSSSLNSKNNKSPLFHQDDGEIQSKFSVLASGDQQDMLLPVLTKMRILNAQIQEKSGDKPINPQLVHYHTRNKSTKDQLLVIEGVDLLSHGQVSGASPLKGPLGQIDHASLIRHVDTMKGVIGKRKLEIKKQVERKRKSDTLSKHQQNLKLINALTINEDGLKIGEADVKEFTKDQSVKGRDLVKRTFHQRGKGDQDSQKHEEQMAESRKLILELAKLNERPKECPASPFFLDTEQSIYSGKQPNSLSSMQGGSRKQSTIILSPVGKRIQVLAKNSPQRHSMMSVKQKYSKHSQGYRGSSLFVADSSIKRINQEVIAEEITNFSQIFDQLKSKQNAEKLRGQLEIRERVDRNQEVQSRESKSTDYQELLNQTFDTPVYRKKERYELAEEDLDGQKVLNYQADKKLVVNSQANTILQGILSDSLKKSLFKQKPSDPKTMQPKAPEDNALSIQTASSINQNETSLCKQQEQPGFREDLLLKKNKLQMEKIFGQSSNKSKFYSQAKDFNNHTASFKLTDKNSYNLELLNNCKKQNVVPLPALAKIENQSLDLNGYQLSQGLATALGQTLYNTADSAKNSIIEMFLENNGLRDQAFAEILKGLLRQNSIKKLTYGQNEIGTHSLEPLLELVARQPPHNFEELKFRSLKVQSRCMETLTSRITSNTSLKKLSLTGIPLSNPKISRNISSIIKQNSALIELDLSWAALTPIQLQEIGEELQKNKKLQYLNLSWNSIEEKNAHSQKFIQKLASFIKSNSNLIHLNLNGMSLKGNLALLIPAIKSSLSLLSIHLSSNDLPKDQVRELLKQLKIQQIEESSLSDKSFQIQNNSYQRISSLHLTGLHEDQQQASKIVNNHILNRIKTKVSHAKNPINSGGHDEALVLTRVIGHPELVWNQQNEGISDMYQKEKNLLWKVNESNQCWVCEKWKYVIIFYNKKDSPQTSNLSQEKVQEIEERNTNTIDQYQRFKQEPLIAGSFSNWSLLKMLPVAEFAMLLDHSFSYKSHVITSSSDNNQCCLEVNPKVSDDNKEHYKQQWRRIMQSDLKQPEDILLINYPTQQDNQADDKLADTLYVFSGLMRPGRHQYTVKDQNIYVGKQIAVDIREQELEVCHCVQQQKRKRVTKVFSQQHNVFKEWKVDTKQSLKKMVECDVKSWKVPRFVKSQQDVNDCKGVLVEYMDSLKKLFTCFACISSYPTITMLDFSRMCQLSGMIDNKPLSLATLDRLFIASNVELVEMDDNPDKELCRFEFLEILVRIVGPKYVDTGVTKTYSEGLRKLIEHYMLPLASQYQWQEFRDEELWTPEINNLLHANLEGLKKVFKKFTNLQKHHCTCKQAVIMIKTVMDLADKDIVYCFGMSKMSVVDDLTQTKQYDDMKFVEFLEFIGRLADFTNKQTSYHLSRQTLKDQMELVLDKLLSLVSMMRLNTNTNITKKVEETVSDTD